jgi:hypothetical protein
MHFLLSLLQPHAVLMLFVAAICLLGYGFPSYKERSTVGFFWILWLLIGILALVSWVILVFS